DSTVLPRMTSANSSAGISLVLRRMNADEAHKGDVAGRPRLVGVHPRLNSFCSSQHSTSVLTRLSGYLLAGQHAGELLDAFRRGKLTDRDASLTRIDLLVNDKMMVGKRGDLRLVCYAEYLL